MEGGGAVSVSRGGGVQAVRICDCKKRRLREGQGETFGFYFLRLLCFLFRRDAGVGWGLVDV